MTVASPSDLLTAGELAAQLRAVGEERYHHRHPFHLLMHEGRLTRGQLQAWALNRFYYQSQIPVKDALVLAHSNDPEFRRAWRKRVVDHDGTGPGDGGIERWLRLAEATGLSRERVESAQEVLPATRYAVNAYLELAEQMDRAEVIGEAFNFSDMKPLDVRQICAATLVACGRTDLEPVVLGEATNEIKAQYLSSDKARARLGWAPRFGLEQGLAQTVGWYREHLGLAGA